MVPMKLNMRVQKCVHYNRPTCFRWSGTAVCIDCEGAGRLWSP